MKKLSIIIPAYNEARTIGEVIRRVLEAETGYHKEIVVVDDGSTDATAEFLRDLSEKAPNGIRVLFHPRNRGKGAAVRTALLHVTGEVVVIQDADVEYDPADYHRLLEPIAKGQADVVFGNRFHGQPQRCLYYWHSPGNWIVTTISNMLTNLNLSDMEVGYKIFRTEILRKFDLQSERFGFEPEVTMKMAKLGCRFCEVPVSYHARSYEEGKKLTWRDGFVTLYCLFRYRFFD